MTGPLLSVVAPVHNEGPGVEAFVRRVSEVLDACGMRFEIVLVDDGSADDQSDGDVVFEDQGLRILVDNQSLPYVDGSEIDYVDSLQGAGFQVNNPNVVAACGCGSSFRVEDEEQG